MVTQSYWERYICFNALARVLFFGGITIVGEGGTVWVQIELATGKANRYFSLSHPHTKRGGGMVFHMEYRFQQDDVI
jgi:hypothetical protein